MLDGRVDDPARGDAAEDEEHDCDQDQNGQDADDPGPILVPDVLEGGPARSPVGAVSSGPAVVRIPDVERRPSPGQEAEQPQVGPPGHDLERSLDQVAVVHFGAKRAVPLWRK